MVLKEKRRQKTITLTDYKERYEILKTPSLPQGTYGYRRIVEGLKKI